MSAKAGKRAAKKKAKGKRAAKRPARKKTAKRFTRKRTAKKKAAPRKKVRAKKAKKKRRRRKTKHKMLCVKCRETVVCEEADKWVTCDCGLKYLRRGEPSVFVVAGLNVCEMYVLFRNNAGFWIHRANWQWPTKAMVLFVQLKASGPLSGEPPDYENARVWVEYYTDRHKTGEGWLPYPGHDEYHWLLPGSADEL